MSKKTKQQLKGPALIPVALAEQIKHDFEEAQRRGDPIAALAEQLAQMENVITIQGESLGTLIEDTSVKLDVGQYLPRPADFVFSPDGAMRNIKTTTEPALIMDHDIEVHPERLVRDKVLVENLACSNCGDKTVKPGWNVEAPDYPNGLLLLQCLKCQNYLWTVRGKSEEDREEEQAEQKEKIYSYRKA